MPDSVTAVLPALVRVLGQSDALRAGVIPWASPIAVFGNPAHARVATLGINPSSREFVNGAGRELDGPLRRFHTLRSLGLSQWEDATLTHLQAIRRYCVDYFHRNPYDAWFKKLDYVLAGAGATYYGIASSACHLDLVPYATGRKWTELRPAQRGTLLSLSGQSLGPMLRDSPVQVLILNGRSVISEFERLAAVQFKSAAMPGWTLPRRTAPGVVGSAKWGITENVGGVSLGRDLVVLGFNHNLQSSFGVTKVVMKSIRRWISDVVGTARSEGALDSVELPRVPTLESI